MKQKEKNWTKDKIELYLGSIFFPWNTDLQ